MSRRLLPHEMHILRWIRASELRGHADRFVEYLIDQGYRNSTIHKYRAAIVSGWRTHLDDQCVVFGGCQQCGKSSWSRLAG